MEWDLSIILDHPSSMNPLMKEIQEIADKIAIFKDRIIVINFSKKPIAFIIEDPKIAQSHQAYFDYLWKIAKTS